MEGFVGRRDLLDVDRLLALGERSDARGALQLGSHLLAIAISGWALAQTWGGWLAVPVFLLHGALINLLYCAQHELSHSTVFRRRWLNEWAGRVIGFIGLYPRDFDQIQHFAHHRHTGDWQRDAELQRPPYTLARYLLWFLGPAYWYSRITRLLRLCAGTVTESYVRVEEHPRVIREARLHVAGYVLVALVSVLVQSEAVLVFWLGPMLLTKWAYMLQGTLEHLGRPHNADLFDNTRSARCGVVMRWLCWNMQYHTAHHLFPAVPFHRLPALHADITARIRREPPTMGYLEFQREVLAQLARGGELGRPQDAAWVGGSGGREILLRG